MDPKAFRQTLRRIVRDVLPVVAAGTMVAANCSPPSTNTPDGNKGGETIQDSFKEDGTSSDSGGTNEALADKHDAGTIDTIQEAAPDFPKEPPPPETKEMTPDEPIADTQEATPEVVADTKEMTPDEPVADTQEPKSETTPEETVMDAGEPKPEITPEETVMDVKEAVIEVNPPDIAPPQCAYKSISDGCNSQPRPGKLVEALPPGTSNPLTYQDCIQLCEKRVKEICPQSQNGRFASYRLTFQSCKEDLAGSTRLINCEYNVSKACAVAGRRPAGLVEQDTSQALQELTNIQELGVYFADLAYLEEAAVTAFEYLTRELEEYNAPQHMVDIARRGIQEEVEHAEMMRALADRYHAIPRKVEVEPFQLRPLVEIAEDNAREGCMRETYGALMAMWQSETSVDEAVRAVMHRVAHEESIHAALSWEIHKWLMPQLTAEEQQRIEQIREEAFQELEREIEEAPTPLMEQVGGYPSVEVARALFAQLKQELWA